MTRHGNETERSFTRATVVALAVVAGLLTATAAWSQDLRTEPVPTLDTGQEPRMMAVSLDFDSSGDATFVDSEVVFQFGRAKFGDPPLLLVEVFDDEGNLVETFNAWNPRWAFVIEGDGTESLNIQDQASETFMFDFDPNLQDVDFTDVENDRELISVDLRPSIREFCEDMPLDPECEQADLEVVSLGLVGPVPLTAVGSFADLTVRTTFRNNGPSGPIDAHLTKTATPAAGLTVTPTIGEQPEDELGLGEEADDDQVYRVRCDTPGIHSVTFASSIELVTVAATDPDLTNNDAELMVQLDCAVPVSINIKPGETPNSINLEARRGIPVALLTTSAGENGNPLAFDAATANPLSARFGERSVVTTTAGGAIETHGRGHIQDALELDNQTRDGDPDMVLHFAPAGTGLTTLSTEGCLAGEFSTGGGSPLRFLGCGPVRIIVKRR